jgi:hypothetical protein
MSRATPGVGRGTTTGAADGPPEEFHDAFRELEDLEIGNPLSLAGENRSPLLPLSWGRGDGGGVGVGVHIATWEGSGSLRT